MVLAGRSNQKSLYNQSGGGRRTRTFEVIRRLIYSQLPLPLGTLPRSTASQPNRRNGAGQATDDVNTESRWRAPGRARLWAKAPCKVNQCGVRNNRAKGFEKGPNCHNPEPVTQALP